MTQRTLTEEQRAALLAHGYDPELPFRGVGGGPGVIQFATGPAMRNRVCYLDGIHIDPHEFSDLDVLDEESTCLHCGREFGKIPEVERGW